MLLIVLALDFVLFTAFGMAEPGRHLSALEFVARKPGLAFFCTVLALSVVGISSLFKSVQLREGGGAVARALGGVRVSRDTTDFKRKRLLNVVEEMAIASGVPMPEVYLLEQETAINAFAAGHTPANAAIAVTQGALDTLSRDELQGVIGHEFSHVLNGDMRLNLQLIGWLFGLFVVAFIGRKMLRIAPDSDKAAPVARDRRHRGDGARLSRDVLRAADPGWRQPNAGAARGCVERAVHAQSGCAQRRAAEDRGRQWWIDASFARMRSRRRTCCSRRGSIVFSRRIRRLQSASRSSIRAST